MPFAMLVESPGTIFGWTRSPGEIMSSAEILGSRLQYIGLAALSVAGLLFGQPAVAQSQAASTAGEDSSALESVTVTAQRRSERLQDVPITVTNMTAEQLANANIKSFTDIQTLAPAVRFDISATELQPTIRGVGTAVVTSGEGANVGIYVDGFYNVNPQALDFQLLNVQSIQVLEGPQGTLFGRNTTAGAILVSSTKPSQTTSAIADVSYGNYATQRYQEYFTTGITENLAVDLAGVFFRGNGYTDNDVNGSDTTGAFKDWMIRAGVKYDPTDEISILFHYLHDDSSDPSALMTNAYSIGGAAQSPGSVLPGAIVATRPNTVANAAQAYFQNKSDAEQLTVGLDLGVVNLTSYSQFRQDSDAFGRLNDEVTSVPAALYPCATAQPYCEPLTLTVPSFERTITQEFLLTSKPGGRLNWTGGLFYMNYKEDETATLSFFGGPDVLVATNGTETVSTAAYFDATYQVLDPLFLTAGVRYSHDEVKNAYFEGATGRQYLPTLTGNPVSPRFVLRYSLNSASSAYISFTRAFKSSIYNVGGNQTTPVAPESINAYEVGYKYAAGSLSANLASFFYDYKDLQIANYTTTQSIVSNAANSRIYGFEAQGQYQVTHDFDVTANGTYLHARYRNYTGAPSYQQCLDAVACGGNYGFQNQTSVDLLNQQMMRAPTFAGSVGSRYVIALSRGNLALSANLYYTTKVTLDPTGTYRQGAYPLLGLRAEWTDPSARLSVALYADNVTDRGYRTEVSATTAAVSELWGHPATYGGEIKYRFGGL
jgi:iron complex outermembrane receptor protein